MTQSTVRIRPNKGGRFMGGFPWLYPEEVVLDRRTRGIAPGSVVRVESPGREPVCLAAFNPAGGIALRDLDRNPDAEIDAVWVSERLSRAINIRDRVIGSKFYRLCHAEADGLPGLVVDRFGDAVSVQPNSAWAEAMLDVVLDALDRLLAPEVMIVNRDGRGRAQEGLDAGRDVVKGVLEGPVRVEMNGAIYLADLLEGQKTGLYFDQRPNHAFAAPLSGGGSVLDVFSHTGGFALAALAAGASRALAIDGSQRALDLATEAAALNGWGERFTARRDDAFEAMRSLGEDGQRFDHVICDPPAFAPSKQALEAGLRAYQKTARLAASLVADGGYLTLCSCSHAATPDLFREACMRGIANTRRRARLIGTGRAGPDHPSHSALPEGGYLKALTYALD